MTSFHMIRKFIVNFAQLNTTIHNVYIYMIYSVLPFYKFLKILPKPNFTCLVFGFETLNTLVWAFFFCREPPLKPSEWDKLLADMLKLRDEIFDCISASVCYEVGQQLASVARESQVPFLYKKSRQF